MKYLGDFASDQTVYIWFNTIDSAGDPVTIDGVAAVEVYENADTTQLTAGITVTEDVDGVVGLHLAQVDLTNAAYTAGNDYFAVISLGDVDGVSILGGGIGHFSVENRAAGSTTSAYFATVKVDPRGASDKYIVQWYKDAALANTVTLPDLQVIDSTGSDLIAAGGNDTELVIDGNAVYYTEATDRMVEGETYIVKVTATIDGSARVFKVPYIVESSKELALTAPFGTVASSPTTTGFISTDFVTNNGTMGTDSIIDRWILFTSGTNLGIARLITDYAPGVFTYEATTSAPTAGDSFRVVGAYKGA